MRRASLLLLLLVLALLGAMAAKSLLVEAPELRASSAAGQFDAVRAKQRLARILGDEQPHPADTAASDSVRQRLLREIAALGLQPQVRDEMACNELHKAPGVSCARVRNIVVTIGPEAGRHLLLNTHYDSSVAGPGAADAGIGVATLLEVASILRNEQLPRPVTLLFNEGEELGLIGARAFLERDPLAARVDSLINLEARGTTGPANMFETSLPNAAPVRIYDRAVERPVANSLATDAYRQLPNYTDVNSFEERGWLTLNLAIIGNESRYHSPGDNLAALDLRSLQHMGDQTLALARELGRGAPESDGNLVFMDILSRALLTLPLEFGLALLGALFLLFLVVALVRRSIMRGTLTVVGSLLLAAGLAWASSAAVGAIVPGAFWRAYPVWTHLAVYASSILAAIALLTTLARRLDARQLRAAFWFVFLAIGGIAALLAPGGIVYFLLPPAVLALGILVGSLVTGAERLFALLAGLTGFLTLGAMLAQLEEMLSSGPMWLFAPLGLLVMMPFLIETKPIVDRVRRPLAIAIPALVALLGWTAAAAVPNYSQDRQQRFAIEYIRDATQAKSWLAIDNDGAPLPPAFGSAWERQQLPHSKRKRWAIQAGALERFRPPAVQPVSASPHPEGRRVRIRISANGSDSIALLSPDSRIVAAGTEGFLRPLEQAAEDEEYVVRCTGRSCDGLTLDLVTAGRDPVDLKIVGTRFGLPSEARSLLQARPAHAQPQYTTNSVITVGRTRL